MLREGLKISTVALIAIVVTVLSWGVGRWWLAGGGSAFRVGWLAGALLIGMAVIVVVTGSRMWRMRHGRTHVEPVVAARVLVLAQASALTGTIVGAIYLGQSVALAPDHDFAGRGTLALQMAFAAVGGALMTVAGMLVQSWCRIEDDDDEDDGGRQA